MEVVGGLVGGQGLFAVALGVGCGSVVGVRVGEAVDLCGVGGGFGDMASGMGWRHRCLIRAAYLTDCLLHTSRNFAFSVHATGFVLGHSTSLARQIGIPSASSPALGADNVFSSALGIMYLNFREPCNDI